MKNGCGKIFLASLLAISLGCGQSPKEKGAQLASESANHQSLMDLNALMKENPKLAQANLKEIKDAASGHNHSHHHLDMQFAVMPEEIKAEDAAHEEHEHGLDAHVAKEAQDLIDKILNDFDMKAHMESGLKIAGLAMKDMKKQIEEMHKLSMGKGMPMAKDMGMGKTMELPKSMAMDDKMKDFPSCEDVQSLNFKGMNEAKFDEAMKANQSSIKEHISGCAKIIGKDFVDCLEKSNQMVKHINQYATCSLDGIEGFVKLVNSEEKIDFNKLGMEVSQCMEKDFSECGYKAKSVDPKTARERQ